MSCTEAPHQARPQHCGQWGAGAEMVARAGRRNRVRTCRDMLCAGLQPRPPLPTSIYLMKNHSGQEAG